MSKPKTLADLNLEQLDKVNQYSEAHKKDFVQVFFKPDPKQIVSQRVGAFYDVQPSKTLGGFHTAETCKMNAAIEANRQVDYESPTKFSKEPKLNYLTVNGDFAGDPNFFLTAEQISSAVESPLSRKSVSQTPYSVEITGYIAAQKPGTYRVVLGDQIPPKNLLVWIGNNASKTYRKENAIFSVENLQTINDKTIDLTTGVYTPFRMQYSVDKTEIAVINMIRDLNNMAIVMFSPMIASQNKLHYYSITPSEHDSLFTCSIYKDSELSKENAKRSTKRLTTLWSQNLPKGTSFVGLDDFGQLCAYSKDFVKTSLAGLNLNVPSNGGYKMVINESSPLLQIDYGNNKFFTIFNGENVNLDNAQQNANWAFPNNVLGKVMKNSTTLIMDNKVIPREILSSTKPFVSGGSKIALVMQNDILSLLKSDEDNIEFYTAEPDIKMNKLYYGSMYPNNKYLKEVSPSLQSYVGIPNYNVYPSMFPNKDAQMDEIACGACDNDPTCKQYYKVTSAKDGEKCFKPKDTPVFLPKQPNSDFDDSTLYIKAPKIFHQSDVNKRNVYNDAIYVVNGYDYTGESRFSKYTVEQDKVVEEHTPGPEGTSYVAQLINTVAKRTNGTMPITKPIEENPMVSGVVETFESKEEEDDKNQLYFAGALAMASLLVGAFLISK
jgi:hypothetical protein